MRTEASLGIRYLLLQTSRYIYEERYKRAKASFDHLETRLQRILSKKDP